MDCSPARWLPHSCFRLPAWRWSRASWLCQQGKGIDRRIDDQWVARAKRLLATVDQGSPASARTPSSRADPTLRWAWDLWREEHPHRRWMVEALLLTAEPLAEVARRCGLAPATVEVYHQVFYDVRPFLGARDWVMAQAVGALWWAGFSGLPLGALWKYAAFAAGSEALEVMIALTTDTPLPAWVSKGFTLNPAYEEQRLRLRGKLLVAALSTDSDDVLGALAKIHGQFQHVERRALGRQDEPAGVLTVMDGFLQAISRGKPRRRRAAEQQKAEEQVLRPGGAGKTRRRPSVSSLLAELMAARR